MNLIIGLVLVVTGTAIVVVGLSLAVAEMISGRHRREGPRAEAMAGLNWEGLAAVLNGIAAIGQAFKDWPLSALFVAFGLVFDCVGVWVLAAKPI